jgi:hypothetical protein
VQWDAHVSTTTKATIFIRHLLLALNQVAWLTGDRIDGMFKIKDEDDDMSGRPKSLERTISSQLKQCITNRVSSDD